MWGGEKGNKNYLYNHQLLLGGGKKKKKNINSTKLNTAESTRELCALSLEKKFAAYWRTISMVSFLSCWYYREIM